MRLKPINLTPRIRGLAYWLERKIKFPFGRIYDLGPWYWNYAFVGGLGILVNYVVFLSLNQTILAWWLGIFSAWQVNAFLSRFWVFKQEEKS